MRKTILILGLIIMFLYSCSKDDSLIETNPSRETDPSGDTNPSGDTSKVITIKSFSKNYGTSGETVIITGENFPTQTSDISISFDAVPATILSAKATEISFVLPTVQKLIPKLIIAIKNNIITNPTTNSYEGNIGILPPARTNTWQVMDNGLNKDGSIFHTQIQSDKVLYYSMYNNYTDMTGTVYRTLDGGITWKAWSNSGFHAMFYATSKDEGWSETLGGIRKVSAAGPGSCFSQTGGCMAGLYIDENSSSAMYIASDGDVYTTNDGGSSFSLKHTSSINYTNRENGCLKKSQILDPNHIWAIGYKRNPNNYYDYIPFVLYKNRNGDWSEYTFPNEPGLIAKEVCFADSLNGFLTIRNIYEDWGSAKLYKTTDGGESWSKVFDAPFFKLAFKDANTGWFVSAKSIYKTTNGGVSWAASYDHNENILDIVYKDNVVWAISKSKILKLFL